MFFKSFLLFIVLISVNVFAKDKAASSEFVLFADSLSKKNIEMDFSKNLTGVNDPSLLFAEFAGKPLLIYYFSPKCAHCQHHFPTFQNLVKEFEPKGVQGISIALGGYIKKNDIRMFIEQFNTSIPVFQDTEMQFGPTYGTGYVPVVFLVLPNKTFYRYEALNDASIEHIRKVLNETQK